MALKLTMYIKARYGKMYSANDRHIGTDHFVHYREVVHSLEVKMYYHYIHVG